MKKQMNNVKKLRKSLMLSKAELARKAGMTTGTISRVENGESCSPSTKRKLIQALGYEIKDSRKIFEWTNKE